MKKIIWLIILIYSLTLIVGCGSTSDQTTGETVTEQVTVTGTLSTGTIQTSSIKTQSAASNYLILAQNVSTKRVSRVITNSQGEFSLSVDKDSTVLISIVDKSQGQYKGPVVINSEYTGLKCSGSLDLGAIVLDTTKEYAKVSDSVSTSYINTSYKPTLSNGVPIGAGKAGGNAITTSSIVKNTAASGPLLDPDLDGIPDFFDKDNDDDGVLDQFDPDINKSLEGLGNSNEVTSLSLFPNLKIDLGESDTWSSQTYQMFLALEMGFTDPSDVTSIEMTTYPSYVADCLLDVSSAYDFDVSFPGENSSWNQSGTYSLYKAYEAGTTNLVKWAVYPKVQDYASVTDTDYFEFLITYTNGTTENVDATIYDVWYAIPKLYSYKFSSQALVSITDYTTTDGRDRNNPLTIPAGDTQLIFYFYKPKMSTGYIDAYAYNSSVFFYSDSNFNTLINNVVSENANISVTDLGGGQLKTEITIPSTYNGSTINSYRWEIEANSQEGDNASFEIYLNK